MLAPGSYRLWNKIPCCSGDSGYRSASTGISRPMRPRSASRVTLGLLNARWLVLMRAILLSYPCLNGSSFRDLQQRIPHDRDADVSHARAVIGAGGFPERIDAGSAARAHRQIRS